MAADEGSPLSSEMNEMPRLTSTAANTIRITFSQMLIACRFRVVARARVSRLGTHSNECVRMLILEQVMTPGGNRPMSREEGRKPLTTP